MRKRINFSELLKLFVLTAFMVSGINGYSGNKRKNLNNKSTQEREVSHFNAIKSSSSVDVFISQGSSESIKVVADDNVINKIITKVEGSTLLIYTKDIKLSTGKMAVYVTLKELKSLKNTGSGDVSTENMINTENLSIRGTGSGDLKLDLNASNVELEMTGSGDVSLSGIKGILEIQLTGSGDLGADNLNLDQCNVRLSGSGDIRLSGACKDLNITGSSSGDISASKLESSKCSIIKSGSGDVSVWVSNNLYVKSSGSGDVYYKGSPNINSNSSGSGDIRKY